MAPRTLSLLTCLTILGVAVVSPAATRLDLTVVQPISVGHDYKFAPTGGWLLVRGNIPGDGPAELYRLPAAGGVPARISADLPAGRAIAAWRLSPNGSHVIYLADQDLPNINEVFAAPLPSGGFYKLNEPLIDGGSTQGEFVGAASDRVAYVAGKLHGPFSGIVHELFSVPATGGEPIRLSGSMVAGGDVDRIIAQSNGDRVLYLADQEVDGKLELYSVAMSGGTAIKLNPAINDLSGVLPDGIAFSPDGSRVIFQVDRRPDKRVELYSVPAIGGAAVPLHPALPAGSNISLGSQQFSPDGSRVMYLADQNADEVFELFSVPAAGGASVRLNESLVTSGDVRTTGFQFSPDSSRVLYLADQLALSYQPAHAGMADSRHKSERMIGMTEYDRNDLERPCWSDDPFYWTFFVPDKYRAEWPFLDESTKLAVFATARHACEHLRGAGVFDS